MDNNQLKHWGVMGMKWGRRRYQNPDGSLTPEGKRRYAYKQMSLSEKIAYKKKYKAQKAALEKAREARKAKQEFEAEKKKVLESGNAEDILKFKSKLTSDEINKALDRLDADNKASDRLAEAVKKGKKNVGDSAGKSQKTQTPKKLSEMSDSEIQAVVNRMNLEKQYKQVMAEKHKPSKGKAFISKVLDKSGENIATQVATFMLGSAVNALAKNLGDQTKNQKLKDLIGDGNIVNPKKGQKDK